MADPDPDPAIAAYLRTFYVSVVDGLFGGASTKTSERMPPRLAAVHATGVFVDESAMPRALEAWVRPPDEKRARRGGGGEEDDDAPDSRLEGDVLLKIRDAAACARAHFGLRRFLITKIDGGDTAICATPEAADVLVVRLATLGYVVSATDECAGPRCPGITEDARERMRATLAAAAHLPHRFMHYFGANHLHNSYELMEGADSFGDGAMSVVYRNLKLGIVLKQHDTTSAWCDIFIESVFLEHGHACDYILRTQRVFYKGVHTQPMTGAKLHVYSTVSKLLGGKIADLGSNVDGRAPEPVYAMQFLEGLQFLHAHGFAHNDIHRGNVLMQPASELPRKRVILIDFGLAAESMSLFTDRERAAGIVKHLLNIERFPRGMQASGPYASVDFFPAIKKFIMETYPDAAGWETSHVSQIAERDGLDQIAGFVVEREEGITSTHVLGRLLTQLTMSAFWKETSRLRDRF